MHGGGSFHNCSVNRVQFLSSVAQRIFPVQPLQRLVLGSTGLDAALDIKSFAMILTGVPDKSLPLDFQVVDHDFSGTHGAAREIAKETLSHHSSPKFWRPRESSKNLGRRSAMLGVQPTSA